MWRNFEEAHINQAPVSPGAYRLYRHTRIVYVGMAAGATTLRSELQRHLRGDFGLSTQSATDFEYRETPDPLAAHQAYLDFYVTSGLRPR
jgi:hypothetical protein